MKIGTRLELYACSFSKQIHLLQTEALMGGGRRVLGERTNRNYPMSSKLSV